METSAPHNDIDTGIRNIDLSSNPRLSNSFINPNDPEIRRIIGYSHKVLHIVKCDEEMASRASMIELSPLTLPCFWGCFHYGYNKAQAAAKQTYYVVTDRDLIIVTKSYDAGCGVTGDDFHLIRLDTIKSMDVDNMGSGLCGTYSVLKVGTSSKKWGGLYVNSPLELSELLHKTANSLSSAPGQAGEQKVEPPNYQDFGRKSAVAPAGCIRIFVASKAEPSSFKMIIFPQGDYDELWEKVRKLYGNELTQFHLAGEGVRVEDISGLQNNDRLVVS